MIDYTKRQALILTASQPLIDWMLSLNTKNREIRQTQVEAIKRDITAGRWQFTNQGFGIAASGYLTDCQHRLTAIKECGYPPLDILVVTGLSDEAQAVVDTHTKRRQSDIIKLLLNQTVSNHLIAALNVLFRMGDSRNGEKFTHQGGFRGRTSEFDLAAFIDQHEEALTAIAAVIGKKIRAGVYAAVIDYALKYSTAAAVDFAKQISTGLNLGEHDPAYRLIRWMDNNSAGGGGMQFQSYCSAVTACIAHSRGESIIQLRPSSSWSRLPKASSEKAAA